MSGASDDRLLRLIAAGDRSAFDEFYRRTAPWLAIRLRRRCADDDLVAEVMQESYFAVWQAAASYLGTAGSGGSAGGWLWAIAARRLVDGFRGRARLPVPQDVEPRASSPAAEDEALVGIPEAELATALAHLAPELHAVLRSMVLDGLTAKETAVVLGVPEGTVKTRARRAKNQLRRALS